MISIPLTMVARNEERAIGPSLDSLTVAIREAERQIPIRIDPLVVLDDCSDGTREEVERRGVAWVASTGGKVAGQRRGVRAGPFQLFSDADIAVSPPTLAALCRVMLDEPEVHVAFPGRRPLEPKRRTPLARALYLYNRERGYSSQRTWFNGKLFAIRRWSIPERSEILDRSRRLAPSRFYDYAAGMRIDDIYLSRQVVLRHGVAALRETDVGCARFRAPETWLGMYRYYRRMRMEIERLDHLFPETRDVHRQFGTRRPDRLAAAPAVERAYFALFGAALLTCRAVYRIERAYYERLSSTPCDPWPPIPETKAL